jgi:phospholipase C
MILLKKYMPLFLLFALLLSTSSVGSASASHSGSETNTPIEHLIVVMQQNHTFDNYFGTYPGANGIPESTCMTVSLSNAQTAACVTPFNIGTHPITDLSHSASTFSAQYQDGKMTGFVDALTKLNQDGKLAMGYFDDRDIPFYWNLADQYVLFDNYFSSAHTGSIMNRMFSISGQPGSDENRIPANGYGDIPTIFDRLQERGISWKYYIRNYNPEFNYRALEELDYLPPQIQWVPLLSFDRFLDDPELSSHIVDFSEYYTDLQNGTLPAVSYVLLLGATEHPISDPQLGQITTRTMIQTLMESDAWESSALLITYDDWGGWYDHVPPPQVDEYGYGFRVPTMLVSAYARQGHIDHTQLDHTSILKFIESNWDIKPLAARDAQANNITSAFDFSSAPREPVFVSALREAPEARIEPRRIVIYIAYGSAMLFALIILLRAHRKENLQSLHQPMDLSEETRPS